MTHLSWRHCWSCGRILFPRNDGTLPPHRVPAKRDPYQRGSKGHISLTGSNAPWCQGGHG